MLFNSLEFAAFLPIVLAGYYLLVPPTWWRARKGLLLVASYAFYMSWNPAFGLLLLTSTLTDFVLGARLERTTHPGRRRLLVAASLVVNLGLLGFFKYGSFVAENLSSLFPAWHGLRDSPLLDVVLPIGISFYTFESISYTIDVYRGRRASRSLLDFSLFLSFFPHLVAGPIVRAPDFLPRLAGPPRMSGAEAETALMRIAVGFAKKMLIADALGGYVDSVFADPAAFGAANVLLAAYAYAFQIYFDFSGYSDIAIGLARLFGLWLPENFDRPYLAASPREFWQRWHISLSTWLRDYLYIPLGGNRGSRARTAVNLMLTMLLGGLWHGAAWTFVVWGAYHGVLLLAERAWTALAGPGGPVRTMVGRVLTFHLVCAGWLLFRSPDLATVSTLLGRLGVPGFVGWRNATLALALVVTGLVLHHAPPAAGLARRFTALPSWLQGCAYGALAVALFLLSPASQRFIYFQF